MIPGIQSRLSESVVASTTTIKAKTDIIRLTGTTTIATITAPSQGGFGTVLFVVTVDGAVATVTTGNISRAVTMTTNAVTVFVYSFGTAKWYPGAIS